MSRINWEARWPNGKPEGSEKIGGSSTDRKKLTKQRLKTLESNAEYLALREVYLEQNPACVLCGMPANSVHHVVRGTAGRARSLLNSDTWLGACTGPGSQECHDKIEKKTIEDQIKLKQSSVEATIKRLRS